MKRLALVKILTVGAVTLGVSTAYESPSYGQPAPGQRGFWCDMSTGIPTTMYQNSEGLREPWIKWVSDAFSGAGYDPQTRCTEVSGRLESYRRNKQLKYITVGRMNSQNVVCTASQVNGRCEGLIFTLKPDQDAVATLMNLLAWREGQAGAPSLYESGEIPYIDVSERLGKDNETVIPTPMTPANTNSTPPQPTNNNGGMRDL